MNPADRLFPWAVFALGFVSTMFYGWLPFYLPELFPTPVRATGIGVSYNFGRILSAAALLSSTALSSWFGGDIAKMGAVTSLVYAGGLVAAFVIPGRSDGNSHTPPSPDGHYRQTGVSVQDSPPADQSQ